MDEIKNEDMKKVSQSGFNSLNSDFPSWLPMLFTACLFNNKDSISREEHIKMKEDIAELKGKMSMIKKMM